MVTKPEIKVHVLGVLIARRVSQVYFERRMCDWFFLERLERAI